MCDLYNRYEFEYYERGVPAFFQGSHDKEHVDHYSINGTQIRCANIPFPTEFRDGINIQKSDTNSSKLFFDHDADIFTYNGVSDPSYYLKE